MPIEAGSRLGRYEIISWIGAGGMGEVWRATDSRLNRPVAIKILPTELAGNAQLKLRFEREARTISQLNHPHICTLHDFEESDGVSYLVMELLDGESLADRIERGPLPLGDVLRIGREIAQALERAHREGVVHRDLKPGNVMLTRSGVKLLDFGLAKSMVATSASDDLTQHKPLTQEGTILGTLQYMAPEQVAGEEADHRSDIFALGSLLYEMFTGQRAFTGSTRTSLFAAIVGGEPRSLRELQPMTPAPFEHVVKRCLAKDPDDRWQSARDVAAELEWIGNLSSAGTAVDLPAPSRRSRRRGQLAWGAAVAVAVMLAAAGTMLWRSLERPVDPMRVSLTMPATTILDRERPALALSPDGRLVVIKIEEAETFSLWIRSLATGTTTKIPGSDRGRYPFWSPDSRLVAFFAEGKLMKADVSGAPPVVICDAPNGRGGSWNREGTIIFAPNVLSALHRVSAGGGVSQPVTTLDDATESTHRWPWFLPDGSRFVYFSMKRGVGPAGQIWLASLDGTEKKLLVETPASAIVASGRLLYTRDGNILAQPLDARAGRLTGDAVPLISGVSVDNGSWHVAFTASEKGSLAYLPAEEDSERTVTIYDQAGAVVQRVEEIAHYGLFSALSFSPDGKRLAVEVRNAGTSNDDLWLLELDRGIRTRITFDPAGDYVPAWAPRGGVVAFSRAEAGKEWYVMVKDVDGGGDETVLFAPPGANAWATGWSPDGRLVACTVIDSNGNRDVVIVPVDGSAPRRFLNAPYREANPTFSPDGKWIAYSSNESGRNELYLISWPDRKGKQQISTGGIVPPEVAYWSDDQIRYFAADGNLTSVRVRPNGSLLDLEKPRRMFEMKGELAASVSPDGSRIAGVFLSEESEKRGAEVVELILNWPEAIARPTRE